jgi:cytochrome oxidase Cu insertion factor (SCO1/SenC/PrrC family)
MKDGRLMERQLVVILVRGLLLLVLFGIFLGLLWIWQGPAIRSWLGGRGPGETLEVFGTVPDFSLIERSGRRVGLADLAGKVWIANFIYTHCPDTCPLQSAQMTKLQTDFAAERDLLLVSITVDPERDTREVLSEYAKRYDADRDRWLFLTGVKKAIYRLAQEGFRLSVVDPEEKKTSGRFFEPRFALAHHGETGKQYIHSARFVLVDRQAQIRGYYHSDEAESLRRLRQDARALLREKK